MLVHDENCRCSPCLLHPHHLITTHPSSTLSQPSSSCSQALLPTPFPYITNTVDPPHPQHSPAALLRLGSRHSSHRTPLDHLALVVRGTNLPRPHRSVMIGKIVLGRLSHPGHCTDSRKKIIHSLPVKKTFTCPGASTLGIGFSTAAHREVADPLVGNMGRKMQSLYPPTVASCPGLGMTCWALPAMSLYTHRKAQFWQLLPRNTPKSPGLEVSRDCRPTGLFTYFNSCCLRIWLSICLKLGTDSGSKLFGTLTGLKTPSTTGTCQE